MDSTTITTRPVVGTAKIAWICKLHDDIYRNQMITYAYDDISRRLADRTGHHANWFTFARWSSFTVGENLRLDKPSDAFETLMDRHAWLQPVRSPLAKLNHSMRTWSDAAMPRTLALGNRLVFHEIAHAVAAFLEWCDRDGRKRSNEEWCEYRQTIVGSSATELFPDCDIEWLRDGIEAYFLAMSESDPGAQSRLVLRGNVMLAAYEQWRLQPIVALALDPIAKNLVEFADSDMHSDNDGPRAVLKRARTPWAFRHRSALGQFAMERYQSFMTRHVMAWQGPITPDRTLLFGRGIPDWNGRAEAEALDSNDPNTRILEVFDRSGGTPEGRTADNWARFSDRMNFIVHLFRAGHDEQSLFEELSDRELRIVALDLSDENLDRLRAVGDPPADDLLATMTPPGAGDPRALIHRLIKDDYPTDKSWYGPGDIPAWVTASPERFRAGREFLRDYGLEIGAALFFASLPFSYTAARGAHVLTRTAELTTGRTSRRLAETGQLLMDLMAEGGMDSAADADAGVDTTIPLGPRTRNRASVEGVRLFHAVVRRMIDLDPKVNWDHRELGVPINQEDLIGTLVVFTVVVVDALAVLGIDFSRREMREARDDYIAYWLGVGALLGIDFTLLRHSAPTDPTALPLSLEELRLVGFAIFRRQAEPSLGGQTLTASLLEATTSAMPRRLKSYPAAAIRGFLGNQTADALAVPPAGSGRLIFSGVRVTTRLVSSRIPNGGRALASASTKALYKYWIKKNHGDFPVWRIEAAPAWGLKAARPPDLTPNDVDLVAAEQNEGGAAGPGDRAG